MTDSSIDRQIVLNVDRHEGDLLKLAWRTERPWGATAYLVRRQWIEEYSAKSRDRLASVVAEAMDGRIRQCGAALKELAYAGHQLYRALFAEASRTGTAEKKRMRLESLTAPCRLCCSMGAAIYIPWGLVYSGDPARLPDDESHIDLASYTDFWAFKYNVSSFYYTVDPECTTVGTPVQAIVNRTIVERAKPMLTDADRESWTWVERRFGPLIFDSKEWQRRWGLEKGVVGLLYFYAHGSGGGIGVGELDTMSSSDLGLEFGDAAVNPGPPCLIFLNGCSTAVGDPNGGFLTGTANARFCGFIGTEAPVPDLYAARFGSAFLCEFMRGGKTALEVIAMLRNQHWPLSLLYTVSCVPDLRTSVPEPNTIPPDIATGNFCDLELGTGMI